MTYPQTLPAKNVLDGSKTPATTNGEMKVALGQVRDYLDNILGADGTKATAISSLGITSADMIENLGMSFAISSNSITAALVNKAGSTPSAQDPITIGIRSGSTSVPNVLMRQVTGSVSINVPAGATLGHESGVPMWLYWYVIDNAGTIELAVSATDYGSFGVVNTTALDTNSDSIVGIYSTNARTGIAFQRIARSRVSNTSAGIWQTGFSIMELEPFAQFSEIAAKGECVLSYVNTSTITLSPRDGNIVSAPDGDGIIPSAGLSLSPSSLTPGTMYYIYAVKTGKYFSSLEASTTAPAVHSQSGIMIKTGDATRILVGIAEPVTGPAWSLSDTSILVRSWFNDQGINGIASLATTTSIGFSPWAELSGMRVTGLFWSGEIVKALATITCQEGTSGQTTMNCAVGLNGSGVVGITGATNFDFSSGFQNVSAHYVGKIASTGKHYLQLMAGIAGSGVNPQAVGSGNTGISIISNGR